MTLEELNIAYKNLFQEYHTTKWDLVATKAQLEALQQQVEASPVPALEIELATRKGEQAKLQLEYDMLKTHHAECDTWVLELKTMRANYGKLEKRIQVLQDEAKVAKSEISTLKIEKSNLLSAKHDVEDTLDGLDASIVKWGHELGVPDGSLLSIKAFVQVKLDTLVEALEAERKEVATLKAKYEAR